MAIAASDVKPKRDILTAAKGSGISFFGSLFEYALRFVFSIVITRSIGAEQFGLYELALTVATFASVLGGLGLPAGVMRFVSILIQDRDKDGLRGLVQTAVVLAGVAGLLLAVSVFALADPLADRLMHEPRLASSLRLVSIVIPLGAVMEVAGAATRGSKQMQYDVSARSVVFQIVKLVLTIVLIGLGLGVAGALTAHIIASVVGLAVLFYFLHQLFSVGLSSRPARRHASSLLRFSLPLYFSTLISRFSGTLETLLLGITGTAVAVGVYAVASRVSMLGRLLLLSVSVSVMPIVSDLYHRNEYAKLGTLYQSVTKWCFSFNLPFFLTTVLFSRPILSVFGADFGAGATSLIVLSLGILIDAATGIPGVLLSMSGRSKLNMFNTIVTVILTIGFDLWFIPRWGMLGAAAGVVFSLTLKNVLDMVEVLILLRLWPYNRSFLKPLAAGLLAAALTILVGRRVPAGLDISPGLVVGAAVLWVSYAASLMLLGLSEDDLEVTSALRTRMRVILQRFKPSSEA